MKYLCLIYSDPSTNPAPESPEFGAMMAGYGAFGEEVHAAGVFVAGEPLQPVETATSVRVRNGESQVTDGPFAETKEHLGGFYVLDCKDLDEALAYAAKIPTAGNGTVEVRPIMVIPGLTD